MYLDVRPRGAGKTKALFAWLLEAPPNEYRVVMTFSDKRVVQLYRQARAMGFAVSGRQFVSWEQVARRPIQPGGGRTLVIAIDDVDMVLTAMFRGAVVRATASSDEVTPADVLRAAGVSGPAGIVSGRFLELEVQEGDDDER